MENSERLGFDFLTYYHVQKEIILNKNFSLIDKCVWNNVLASRSLAEPNTDGKSQKVGDMYLVPQDSKFSRWDVNPGKIAIYNEANWTYISPQNGMMFWVLDEKVMLIYYGDWHEIFSKKEKQTKSES